MQLHRKRHHHKHHHHHKNSVRRWFRISYQRHESIDRKDLFRAAAILAGVLLAGLLVAVGINRWELHTFSNSGGTGSVTADSVFTAPKMVTVKGITYQHRRNLDCYLFMGVDVDGTVADMQRYGGGGQADVQLLAVLDHNEKTWRILQLNRDTLTEVNVLGLTGKVIGVEHEQLALAHAYGSGAEDSCRNTVKAVSSLLWNQPVTGYVAMNVEGIGVLNDALGGVEVTVTSDFSAVDPSLEMGSSVTLHGSQAVNFLRARHGVGDETNLSRMERHRQYLTALSDKLLSTDSVSLLNAYDQCHDYTVANMDSGMILSLAEKLKDYTQLPLLTIAGQTALLNDSTAYLLDEDSLTSVIVELFYEKTT